jgi:hypothetical protein
MNDMAAYDRGVGRKRTCWPRICSSTARPFGVCVLLPTA